MSDLLRRYLEPEGKLRASRVDHPDDTPEEDAILDQMEFVWRELSQEERDWMESHHVRSGERLEPETWRVCWG
jgi:hypothetical protein